MDVKKEINDWVESKTEYILNYFLRDGNYTCKRNNLNSNDLDLLVSNGSNDVKVDAQYSFNFEKYGDVRIDLISAGLRKKGWDIYSVFELNKILEQSQIPYQKLEEIFDIRKKGKYFTDDNNLGVFYFLYNQEKPKELNAEVMKKIKIDKMVFIPTEVILSELKQHNRSHIYKINDKKKNKLKEEHDSAFVCLNIKYLCEKYSIPLFESKEEMSGHLLDFF